MAINLRSELSRPISLALAGIIGLLLAAVIIQATVRSQDRRQHQEQVSGLLQIQSTIQSELDRLKALAGTATEVQSRIVTGEQHIRDATQTAALTRAQIASLEDQRKQAEQKAAET